MPRGTNSFSLRFCATGTLAPMLRLLRHFKVPSSVECNLASCFRGLFAKRNGCFSHQLFSDYWCFLILELGPTAPLLPRKYLSLSASFPPTSHDRTNVPLLLAPLMEYDNSLTINCQLCHHLSGVVTPLAVSGIDLCANRNRDAPAQYFGLWRQTPPIMPYYLNQTLPGELINI